MGAGDGRRATRVFLEAQSPTPELASGGSQNPQTCECCTVICLARENFALLVFQRESCVGYSSLFL